MSELIDNTARKKADLKKLILQLHEGNDPETVRRKVMEIMGDVPYGLVVEVEQELISEGLPTQEVLNLCDLHSAVLHDAIDLTGAKVVPEGHPVHTFELENRALEAQIRVIEPLLDAVADTRDPQALQELMMRIRVEFNALMDVDKHYRRKENLLFPFLENHGITGPPTVMWGKHDQIRAQMKAAFGILTQADTVGADEMFTATELALKPVLRAIIDMIGKEEKILHPMAMDRLTDVEWYQIAQQSPEIGFCLVDPTVTWQPELSTLEHLPLQGTDRINLPSGSFTIQELTVMLNTLPVDLTFVDKDDNVRYFTQGRERIFDRNRAILGRKVQMCHPPHSVHIVNQIVDDFRSGRQDSAAFWIEMGGKFIHIEYFAMRDEAGSYLGTVEVSQNLTGLRALTGERRLLTYDSNGGA